MNTDFYDLTGVLDDGSLIALRSSGARLNDNVKITLALYTYVGVFAIIIGCIAMFVASSFYVKPIKEMAVAAKKMAQLDFDTRVTTSHQDEIGALGASINSMSKELETTISELKTANVRLAKDIEKKNQIDEMRKEFLSHVSHELKTPIALIQGYAEGLQEGIMDDENSRQIYLDIIIDEANKMNRLVREMLILNQLEAGQMNLDLVDFDVTEMIDSIVDSNKINFEAQNISYSFENKVECYVHADEFLVEQVITNFVSNAIHYVLNENIIRVRYDFIKKGKVRISVFNSGNNIAKKDIKRIWEKFYKADKARSREYGGSGIGLSVVKATMDLLHEKFGVENVPDGVEFWCELTLAKDTKINKNS